MHRSTSYVRVLLAVILLLSSVPSSLSAAVPSADSLRMADQLRAIQLFQGTTKGYELDAGFTRAQGAVMLLRLLGREQTAKKAALPSAFQDMSSHWAAPYVAYAAANGYVRGVSASSYSPDASMTGAQFLTLILRTLGYTEAEPAAAYKLAVSSGLLSTQLAQTWSSETASSFLREQMVIVAHRSLNTPMKGKSETLIERLIREGAVDAHAAEKAGLYQPAVPADPMDRIEKALRDALNRKK